MGEIDRQRGAGAGIAVRSAGAEHDHGRRQRDGHDVSQENGCRVAGARHGCDPPHGAAAIGTDGEVGCGERAIAFGAIVGRLAGTSVTGIEQPTTESEVVARGGHWRGSRSGGCDGSRPAGRAAESGG